MAYTSALAPLGLGLATLKRLHALTEAAIAGADEPSAQVFARAGAAELEALAILVGLVCTALLAATVGAHLLLRRSAR